MGMYTQLVLSVDLKDVRPEWVDKSIRYFGGLRGAENKTYDEGWPGFNDHALFECGRWGFFLSSNQDFTRFPAVDIGEFGNFQCMSSCKNYTGEIEAFLTWLAPYVGASYPQFCGWMMYEETRHPTLIYWTGTAFERVPVTPVVTGAPPNWDRDW